MVFALYTTFGLLTFFNPANAFVGNCTNSSRAIANNIIPIRKVMEIDDAERLELEQFARQQSLDEQSLTNAFSPTVNILCEASRGVASVVLRGNRILTNAHLFTDEVTCQPLSHPKSCFIENGRQSIRVKRMIRQGFKCPKPTSVTEDWAVLELEANVTNVTPYGLPDKPVSEAEITAANRLVVVGYSSDFTDSSNRRLKHAGVCSMKKFVPSAVARVRSNCDGAFGSSGSSVFTSDALEEVRRNRAPTIVGIYSRSTATPDQESAAKSQGARVQCDYRFVAGDPNACYSVQLLLTEPVLDAIRSK